MKKSKVTKVSLALAGLLATAGARAEITLAEGLTATGFIDMSILSVDTDAGSDTTMGLDQWEIDFMFDMGDGITARVDINDKDGPEGVEVEQAYFEAGIAEGVTFKAGRFLSVLGYEGPEPVDLWQYSYSATIIGYPGYSNGAAISYAAEMFSLYLSVTDGAYSADEDADNVSVEAQFKLFPMEGLTFQAGYASEKFDATEESASYDQGIINFWIEYATGPLTLAAEYNVLMEIASPNGDGDGYLVMGNYAFTDKIGLTLRTSGASLDSGPDHTEYTISPSYAFTDSLFGLLEFRIDEYNASGFDSESYAAELIYSF